MPPEASDKTQQPNISASLPTVSPPPANPVTTPPAQNPPPNPPIDTSIYPQINVTKIENPNRFYAFPLLGIFFKLIILIPVFIFLYIVQIFALIITLINSFVVLFTGKYWKFAFELNKGLISYVLKYTFYLTGLTNKYPGFGLEIKDDFSILIDYPEKSSRTYAIPILGGIIRSLMLIPFGIYTIIIIYGTYLGVFAASFVVLILGRYPDSVFELVRDSTRLMLAQSVYSLGLTDKYPSYKISWDHKPIKITLIAVGVLLVLSQILLSLTSNNKPQYKMTPLGSQQNIQNNIPQTTNRTNSFLSNTPNPAIVDYKSQAELVSKKLVDFKNTNSKFPTTAQEQKSVLGLLPSTDANMYTMYQPTPDSLNAIFLIGRSINVGETTGDFYCWRSQDGQITNVHDVFQCHN